jgi:hydroxymethylglutaryl-CoA lyase
LSESGVAEIEASAFVSPRWVPQLGDASAVFRQIRRHPGVVYSALVPNEKGLDRALEAGVNKIAVFTAASETFSQKNTNTTIDGAIGRFRPVAARAASAGLPVRGYISAAFWCAFEGRIPPAAVVAVVDKLTDIGVSEVSISDTVGKATPEEVSELLDLLLPRLPAARIAMHFHDTYNRGVANILASLPYGIRIFDASVGGLGGCPYSPGATGNVATEDVVDALTSAGFAVGVDPARLTGARRVLEPWLNEDRRVAPKRDLPACAVCEYRTANTDCCRSRVG